jgi:acetyl esterase
VNRYLLALRSADALGRHTVTPWGRLHMRLRGVSVFRDVRYGDSAAHKCDIYLPKNHSQPCPTVFYIHGGGFTALSKDSHLGIAKALLRMGMAVVLPNYRLAPEHPFPAALTDVATAWCHIVKHAAMWGLDAQRLLLAGESAGANLALGLALAACAPLRQPAVAMVHAAQVVPRAVLPLCGLLQVSDAARYRTGAATATPFVQKRLLGIAAAYLGDAQAHFEAERALADPLVMLESGYSAESPLPPMFVGVGAKDPVLHDSERLAAALTKRGVPHALHVYPAAGHAFFALRNHATTQVFWRDTAAFVAKHIA